MVLGQVGHTYSTAKDFWFSRRPWQIILFKHSRFRYITFTLFYQVSCDLSDAHGIVKMHILITILFGEQHNVKCISVLQQRFINRPNLDKLKPTIRLANGLVQLLLILTTTYQNECHTCSSIKSSARSRHRFIASNTKIFIPTTSPVSFS